VLYREAIRGNDNPAADPYSPSYAAAVDDGRAALRDKARIPPARERYALVEVDHFGPGIRSVRPLRDQDGVTAGGFPYRPADGETGRGGCLAIRGVLAAGRHIPGCGPSRRAFQEGKQPGRDDEDCLCETMMPVLHDWWLHNVHGYEMPFVDVFCETGAFNLEQSRLILTKAKTLGFPLKIHADEFDNLGGASLAAELGAVSADHLVKTSPEDIRALAESDTVAVALPCTPFGLAEAHYTPARAILEAGGLLAIATDLNPGTAWCENMQFAIALACRYLRLTPAQAIAAATINAAAAVARADRLGSLEPGKQADLLVLSVSDYRHLGYRFGTNLVQTVIKKGNLYSV